MLTGRKRDNFFSLFFLSLKVQFFSILEQLKVVKRFYLSSFVFFLVDTALLLIYFWKNPYKISKTFLKKRGFKNIEPYGETPLTTWQVIASECDITKEDHFLELGSGRGRISFWMRLILGCPVTSIEYNSIFVRRAKKIASFFSLDNMVFLEEDFLDLKKNLPGSSVCYVYGTCLSDSEIEQLIKKLLFLPKGAKAITISYSLQEYQDSNFELVKEFPVSFAWGNTIAYLQKKIV